FGQEQPRIARFLRENDAQLNANLFCIARRTNRSARGDSAARAAADPDSALELAHGERLALVGPTGAGKSTLAKLIAPRGEPIVQCARTGQISVQGERLARANGWLQRRPDGGLVEIGSRTNRKLGGRHLVSYSRPDGTLL